MSALTDTELVELLDGRPELLAVADAVASTQPRRPRARRRASNQLVAAAAVGAVAFFAPWGRGPDPIDRALAAVSGGPVLHAVVEYSADDAFVDLDTGRETPRVHRAEYWYDGERRVLRTMLSTDGVRTWESVETPRGGVSDVGPLKSGKGLFQLDPVLSGFATGYRDALADGTAAVVGQTKVGGRKATLIEIERSRIERTIVVVDRETYRPLRFYTTYAAGRRSPEWRVVELETLPREAGQFADPAPSPPHPTGGIVTEGKAVTAAEAGRALGVRPLWLGEQFAGEPLKRIELSHARIELSDGREVKGVAVRLRYGRVHLALASTIGSAYVLGMDDRGDAPPPRGSIAVTHDWGGPRNWAGELRVGRFWVTLVAPTRGQLLAAARALRTLR